MYNISAPTNSYYRFNTVAWYHVLYKPAVTNLNKSLNTHIIFHIFHRQASWCPCYVDETEKTIWSNQEWCLLSYFQLWSRGQKEYVPGGIRRMHKLRSNGLLCFTAGRNKVLYQVVGIINLEKRNWQAAGLCCEYWRLHMKYLNLLLVRYNDCS